MSDEITPVEIEVPDPPFAFLFLEQSIWLFKIVKIMRHTMRMYRHDPNRVFGIITKMIWRREGSTEEPREYGKADKLLHFGSKNLVFTVEALKTRFDLWKASKLEIGTFNIKEAHDRVTRALQEEYMAKASRATWERARLIVDDDLVKIATVTENVDSLAYKLKQLFEEIGNKHG